MERKNFFKFGAAVCAASLCVACSDDDPASDTIVDIAAERADLSKLVSALQTAGLVTALKGPGPFTIFAPTDAAFEKLPAGVLSQLLADKAKLEKVLTYHVLSRRVAAEEVATLDSEATVQGVHVFVRVDDKKNVSINEAKVITTDIQASNGIIHIIDTVLLNPPTLVQVGKWRPRFSTLMQAVGEAGLENKYNGEGPFTVFAPTNAAFAKLPAGLLQSLLGNRPALIAVLNYHVVAGKVSSATARKLRSAETVQGASVVLPVASDSLKVNQATVQMADVVAGNGIVHAIDAVLQPSTILELAGYRPDLSTLAEAVNTAGLGGTLSDPASPVTVFAPTNTAFSALPAAERDRLLADRAALRRRLSYHVLANRTLSDALAGLTTATTLQGQTVNITSPGPGRIRINQATVVAPDIKGKNGSVIHMIDGVLKPN